MRSWWFESPEGRVQLMIAGIRLLLLGVVIFVSVISIPPANWPAFILAVSGFYLGVLDPLLRRPRLIVSSDPSVSSPSPAPATPDPQPIRLRLKIANYGQTPAYNCLCRLIELRTGDGQPVASFAPQTLCWAQQRNPQDVRPVTIQGYGDCSYLELAEYTQRDDRLCFRYAGIAGTPQETGDPMSEAPQLVPANAFVRLGIYADGVRNPPIWLQITAQGQVRRAAPPRTTD